MKPTLGGIVLLSLACSSATATLLSRMSGQAYYDTATNLTWVANGNLADSSAFGVAGMNNAAYLGTADWRLPTFTDTGAPGCDFEFTGTDCGYNVDLASGEMARMFYGTLGNTAAFDASANPLDCEQSGPPFCLANSGPFANLQSWDYWYGTEDAGDPDGAWTFGFNFGYQGLVSKTANPYYAWAVRSGDIDADGDGIAATQDNCTLEANPTQLDADGDGYGNLCDADLNNSGLVTTADFGILRARLNTAPGPSRLHP